MKPEKVKSRWRRSSELECGDLNNKSPETIEHCGQRMLGLKESSVKTEQKNASEDFPDEPISKPCQINKFISNQGEKCKIPDFVFLEENQYLFERKRTKRKKDLRRMICDCTLTKEEREDEAKGCDDNCLNRLLMIECGSRCAIGEACSNKRFQKRLYAKAEPFKTEKKGWGLKLLENVPTGSFVIEYVGEVLSRAEFKQRVKQYARENCSHYYFMALKSDEIIDATQKGNLSRFINHSCDPNCETQKWTVSGDLRIGFFAKRDLKAGEELTFDYQFERYGREAQKCYCATEVCSGYIGVSNEVSVDVDVSNSKTKAKRKKVAEEKEKKREALEDLMVEEEIKKLFEIGGLRNRKETLVLARLMVRAEDIHSRNKVLDIILGTTELACLRLFLDYHGLALLWSWMVDVCVTDNIKLKTKILKVLSLLPVPNKTMLLDSKVLSIVQKWSSDTSVQKPTASVEHSMDISISEASPQGNNEKIKRVKLSDTSDSETDGASFQILETKSDLDKHNSNNSSSECENNHPIKVISPNNKTRSLSDDESRDVVDSSEKTSGFSNLACNLLDSWKDLKEVFRIPRLEQQKRQEDEREADRRQRHHVHRHYNDYSSRRSESRNNYDYRERESPNYFARERRYPRNKREKHDENFFCNSRFTEEMYQERGAASCHYDDVMRPPRKVLLPTPQVFPSPRLSKAERRHLFALEVQQRDQEELRKQTQNVPSENFTSEAIDGVSYDQLYYDSTPFGNSYNPVSTYSPQLPFENQVSASGNTVHPCQISAPGNAVHPCQVSASGNAVLPLVSHDQIPTVNSYNAGLVQPSRQVLLPMSASTDSTLTDTTAMYSSNVIYHPATSEIPLPVSSSSSPQQRETACAITLTSCQSNHSEISQVPTQSSFIAAAAVTVGTESVSTPLNPLMSAAPVATAQVVPCPAPISTPAGPNYFQNQPPIVNSQTQQVFYVQPHYSASHLAEQVCVPKQTAPLSNNNGEGSFIPAQSLIRLPPNWKTATDADGNIYYYHVITRETQWNPPQIDVTEDGDSGTPTYDEPKVSKKRSTTTAPADTSCNNITTDIAKKIKELFRTKMSSFIVQCLNPFRKPDCELGRITTTEDFKHLARKLTHFVMAKELKHCKNVEELECNENVKHKAKDFVAKYMAKYGPFYRKEKNSPLGD